MNTTLTTSFTFTHRCDLVSNLQPAILLGRAPVDDLGDEDPVVAGHMLVTLTPSDAEAQPLLTLDELYAQCLTGGGTPRPSP